MSSETNISETKHVVGTETCGNLNVFVQGDLALLGKRPVILTVHDMGSNHNSFNYFIQHPSMSEIRNRVIFVHVDIPGQGDGEPDLPDSFQFPTMQQFGQELVAVLDQLRIKYVVGFGEGAGANILARFAAQHPKRCLGVLLIHPTSTVAGIIELFKDRLMGWKLNAGWSPSCEEYLVFHKFGDKLASAEKSEDRDRMIVQYADNLKEKINPRNLNRFVQSFRNRTDLTASLKNMAIDVMVVVGTRASHFHTTESFFTNLPPAKATFLKIDNVGDVLTEAPEKVAHGFLLFIKGCGMLSSTPMPGQERAGSFTASRSRAMSMEEADQPRMRRGSATAISEQILQN